MSQRQGCNTPASGLTLNRVLPMLAGAKTCSEPQGSLWHFVWAQGSGLAARVLQQSQKVSWNLGAGGIHAKKEACISIKVSHKGLWVFQDGRAQPDVVIVIINENHNKLIRDRYLRPALGFAEYLDLFFQIFRIER